MSGMRLENRPFACPAGGGAGKTFFYILLLGLTLSVLFPGTLPAQFGKNKVQYKNFHWQVLKSQHFDIYFYEKERPMVLSAAKIAERAYTRYSKMLNFKPRRRIPLILYASHADFSQTNVLPGDIDEGLAGVNEFLKKRVILPFTGSWKDFEHVLTHELAHAFQIDIMWGDITPISNPFAFMPPLWFIEGMVEQLSQDGISPFTEMWLRDAALSGYLMSLEELGQMPDRRSYEFGHSFWYFIAQRYGNKKIGEILQKTPIFGNLNGVFKSSVGANLETLSQQWNEDIRKTYLPWIVNFNKPEDFSRRLTDHTKDGSFFNGTPALNSSGEKIAYISLKSGYTDIWLASAIDGRNAERVLPGERSPDFESFRFIYSSLDWSPDDRYLTFVAKSGPEDAVYVYALYNKKVTHQFKFGLDGVLTPNFSPDGKKIVFSGINGGQSDLYLVDIDTGKLTQLTNDSYTQRDPVFSPNGKKIAFTTEYGPGTEMNKLIFSDYRIGIFDLDTGEYSILPNSAGDNFSPQWAPDGEKIAYVSDRSGIPNIYYHDFSDGKDYQVTNILTGISGITETSPCISWSSSSGRLAFSAFLNAGWDIFVINSPEHQAKLWAPDTTQNFAYETVHLKARKAYAKHLKNQLKENALWEEKTYARLSPAHKDSSVSVQAPQNAGAATVPGAGKTMLETNTALAGLQETFPQNNLKSMTLADTIPLQIAGEKSAVAPVPEIAQIQPGPVPVDTPGTQAQAIEDKSVRRIVLADKKSFVPADSLALQDTLKRLAVDTLPSFNFDFDVPKEKIPLPDTSSFSFKKYKARFSTDYVTSFGGYQGNIGVSGGVLVSLSDQLGNRNLVLGANIYGNIKDSDLLFQYTYLRRRTNIGFFVSQFRDIYYLSSLRAYSGQYLANIWRGAGILFSRPFDRFRRLEWGLSAYSVSTKTFELNFNPYFYYPDLKEYNKQEYGTEYFFGPEVALVFDNSAYGMTGPVDGERYRFSAQQFFGNLNYSELVADWRKYWLFFRRFTFAVRGIGAARLGNNPRVFYVGGPYTFRGADYGDMFGTRLLLTNLEFRFPMIQHLVLGFAPVYLRDIGGVLFFDAAGAWFENEPFQFFTSSQSKLFRLKNAQAAYGLGVRFNLGYVVLRFDFAKTLDHYENNYYYYGYQIYKSEELIKGRKRNFFSIGYDF